MDFIMQQTNKVPIHPHHGFKTKYRQASARDSA